MPSDPNAQHDTLARLRAGALAGATRLDLRHCALEQVPPEVFTLADTLEVLDLSGNALSQLPEAMAGLQRLRVLFCSDNAFTTLPSGLGRCPALQVVGFKANRITTVPAEALPVALRWLILTDNRIETLPEALGQRPQLQKLMLAGNRLRQLPASLSQCHRLELLRLAANQFQTAAAALSDGLLALPRLAWLAHAGNPFCLALEQQAEADSPAPGIPWRQLQLQGVLGEGASGVIHAAQWRPDGGPALAVALKLFKGSVTSDGLPASEIAACIAAGEHPHLVGVIGRVIGTTAGHPAGTAGLVLRRIPAGFHTLAGPPSLASCSRDVYADNLRFGGAAASRIARGMHDALAHLHQRGLAHGDLYAHNTVVDGDGQALLGDFGAASFLPLDDPARSAALQRIDRRALGVLIGELANHCSDPATGARLRAEAAALA